MCRKLGGNGDQEVVVPSEGVSEVVDVLSNIGRHNSGSCMKASEAVVATGSTTTPNVVIPQVTGPKRS